MATTVRINLANPQELLELDGIGPEHVNAIIRFRAEHGPIENAEQLAEILRGYPVSDALWGRVDFAPANDSADEGPGG